MNKGRHVKSPKARADDGTKYWVDHRQWDEVFHGAAGDVSDDGPPDDSTPERSLWRAALMQGIIDATTLDTSCVYDPETKNYKNWDHRINALNRTRARAWIFAESGVTAEKFEAVCDMAGFDASVVRKSVKRLIEEGKSFYGVIESRSHE